MSKELKTILFLLLTNKHGKDISKSTITDFTEGSFIYVRDDFNKMMIRDVESLVQANILNDDSQAELIEFKINLTNYLYARNIAV